MAYLAVFNPTIPSEKLQDIYNHVTDPGAEVLLADFTEILPEGQGVRLNIGSDKMLGSLRGLLENLIVGTKFSQSTLTINHIDVA